MGGQAAVSLSLVGCGRSGLRVAMGERGMVDLGGKNGKCGRNRGISPPANLADADPWSDRREQAAAGEKLSADTRGVRAACRDDQLPVRQPAVAGRFRLVRSTRRNG